MKHQAGIGQFFSALNPLVPRRGAIFRQEGLRDLVGLFLCALVFVSYAISLLKRKDQDTHGSNTVLPCCSGVVWAQPRTQKLPGKSGAAPAILTISEKDVRSPVLGGWWVFKVTDERADRLREGNRGN